MTQDANQWSFEDQELFESARTLVRPLVGGDASLRLPRDSSVLEALHRWLQGILLAGTTHELPHEDEQVRQLANVRPDLNAYSASDNHWNRKPG